MRFCPFCAKENGDEAERCAHCGKKLPAKRAARPGQPPPEKRAPPAKTLYGVGEAKAPPAPSVSPPPEKSPTPMPRKLAELEPADKTAPTPMIDEEDAPPPAKPQAKPAPPASTRQPIGTAPTVLAVDGDHNLTAPSPRIEFDDAPPVEPPPTRDAGVAGPGVRAGTLPDAVPEPAPAADTAASPAPSVIVDGQPQAQPLELSSPARLVSQSQLVSVESVVGIDLAALPPMPPRPPAPNVWGAVRYIYPVARGWWARRTAQKKVRGLLVGDQRQLDQVLGELGRAAREERLELPALREEMGQLASSEERKRKAAEEAAQTQQERFAEEKRFAELEQKAQEALAEQDEAVRRADGALREQAERRRAEQHDLHRLEGEIRACDRKSASLEARASRLPPADPNRAAFEVEARQARQRAAELQPQRDEAARRVEALDAPIAQLTQALADARFEQGNRKRALSSTVADRQHALQAIDARLGRLVEEQQHAAGEISRRFVTIGTLLNLNRVERPRFAPLYARVDELKNGLTEREALIARLDDERVAFDHAAVQKGLITVGAAVGGLLIVAVVLILLFAGGGHRCATAADCRAEELCLCDSDGCVDEKTFAARGKCVDRAAAEKAYRRR